MLKKFFLFNYLNVLSRSSFDFIYLIIDVWLNSCPLKCKNVSWRSKGRQNRTARNRYHNACVCPWMRKYMYAATHSNQGFIIDDQWTVRHCLSLTSRGWHFGKRETKNVTLLTWPSLLTLCARCLNFIKSNNLSLMLINAYRL